MTCSLGVWSKLNMELVLQEATIPRKRLKPFQALPSARVHGGVSVVAVSASPVIAPQRLKARRSTQAGWSLLALHF